MAMSGGQDDGEPMMEMNMTPLIDVLLVLLIIFLMNIPRQTHAVKVDLPANNQRNPPPIDAQKNKVSIFPDGTVSWNGQPVSQEILAQYLQVTTTLNPEPELHFQPDPQAVYSKVDETLGTIKKSGITKLGFIGNEQYRNDF